MKSFTKDPGGHKIADPGTGWRNEPGGGGWGYSFDPGIGWKSTLDPGTRV